MSASTERWAGLPALAVAGAALLWGIWWLPLRSLEEAGLNGYQVNLAVYLSLAIVALPYLWRRLRGPLKADAFWFIAASIMMGSALLAWNLALLWGEVVRVSLLFYLTPIWATLLSVLFLGLRLSLLRAATVLCGLAGAVIVLTDSSGLPLPRETADWVALSSGIVFAGGLVITRRWPSISGLPLTLSSFVVAALCAALLMLLGGSSGDVSLAAQPASLLLAAVLVGILWVLPATWMILWGAGHLDAGRVSIILLLEIPVAAASATLIAGEPFGWREGLGCLLILLAGLLEGRGEAIKRRVFS